MLVKLEQLGVFSLMRSCIAKWLQTHQGDGFKIFTALEWFTLGFMA